MNAFRFGHHLRIIVLTLVFIINFLIIIYYFFMPSNYKKFVDSVKKVELNDNLEHFVSGVTLVNQKRLTKLFQLLQQTEQDNKQYLDHLNLLRFDQIGEKLVVNQKTKNHPLLQFNDQIDTYLKMKSNKIHVEKKFIDDLFALSVNSTLKNAHMLNLDKKIINKPVIATASNAQSYENLQATLYLIHLYFPSYSVVVYDLGLTDEMREKTKLKCECELRTFNVEFYAKLSPHIRKLNTYAWKPIIIQELLRDFEKVLYLDTSIRFHSNDIESLVESSEHIGIKSEYTDFKLNCFSNKQTFKWFQENPDDFEHINLSKTNVLMFSRTFLTALFMKTWVTCAFDEQCIAPTGSNAHGNFFNYFFDCISTCACHRFDQSTFSLITTYFFTYSKNFAKDNHDRLRPMFAMNANEANLYSIERSFGMNYF